jgi:hypothetical protein
MRFEHLVQINDPLSQGFLGQAYRSADIDTVWRIRDLVERGELG